MERYTASTLHTLELGYGPSQENLPTLDKDGKEAVVDCAVRYKRMLEPLFPNHLFIVHLDCLGGPMRKVSVLVRYDAANEQNSREAFNLQSNPPQRWA